jgi:hypothetical protein
VHPSEDLLFCRDARAAGFAVGIDLDRHGDHRMGTWATMIETSRRQAVQQGWTVPAYGTSR